MTTGVRGKCFEESKVRFLISLLLISVFPCRGKAAARDAKVLICMTASLENDEFFLGARARENTLDALFLPFRTERERDRD